MLANNNAIHACTSSDRNDNEASPPPTALSLTRALYCMLQRGKRRSNDMSSSGSTENPTHSWQPQVLFGQRPDRARQCNEASGSGKSKQL